jgi:ribosome-binding factor A
MTRRSTGSGRHYPRTARLNKLFREILAEELELIDDERLDMVTVMDVDVDNELTKARVFYMVPDEDRAAEVAEAFAANRVRLQGAIGSQARVRRVPELVFQLDQVTESAARIEAILRDLPETRGDDEAAGVEADGDAG